jgi:hypothetical protein
MPESEARSLHLHTLDSLIADLVSGRPVQTSENEQFVLADDRTRSALEWYRKKGPYAWTANVTMQHGEDLVDAIQKPPVALPALPARAANANSRRLRLKSWKRTGLRGCTNSEHLQSRLRTIFMNFVPRSPCSKEGTARGKPH